MNTAPMDSDQMKQDYEASDLSKRWHLVHLRPNAENVARRNLLRQGVKVFCPFEEITIRKKNQHIHERRSLFPGYLFVSFDPHNTRWGSINSTLGVNRLVSFRNNIPAEVPYALIFGIMNRCDPTGKLLPITSIKKGLSVVVRKGPFVDFIGSIDDIASDQRVWVLLNILGKSTRVSLNPSDLQIMQGYDSTREIRPGSELPVP